MGLELIRLQKVHHKKQTSVLFRNFFHCLLVSSPFLCHSLAPICFVSVTKNSNVFFTSQVNASFWNVCHNSFQPAECCSVKWFWWQYCGNPRQICRIVHMHIVWIFPQLRVDVPVALLVSQKFSESRHSCPVVFFDLPIILRVVGFYLQVFKSGGSLEHFKELPTEPESDTDHQTRRTSVWKDPIANEYCQNL